LRISLTLLTVCHPADMLFDTQVGGFLTGLSEGVRKLKSGTGDVNPTTAVSIFRAER
jgi:hypothetical protein